jgi:hypothetical protein
VSEAPALGFSLVANLGDNRQMTCQAFVGVDEDLPTIHARIDKVQAVIDRQRARYEMSDILKERETAAKTLERGKDDLARVEADYQANLKANDERLVAIASGLAEVDNKAAARGRGGPVGGDRSRVNTLNYERQEIAATKAKNAAERDQYLQNVLVSIERFEEAVADCDRRIAAANTLLDGG